MAKPEWGTKRLCPSCGARFYDLRQSPATCPQCGTKVKTDPLARYRRPGKPNTDDTPPSPTPEAKADGAEDTTPDTTDDDELGGLEADLGDVDDLADDDGDDDEVIEDASDLGEDNDDMSEVMEHIDEDVADRV